MIRIYRSAPPRPARAIGVEIAIGRRLATLTRPCTSTAHHRWARAPRAQIHPRAPQLSGCAAPGQGPARLRRDSEAALPLGTGGRGGGSCASCSRTPRSWKPTSLRHCVWRRDPHFREGCARCCGLTPRPGRRRARGAAHVARPVIVCPEPGGALNLWATLGYLWAGRGAQILSPPHPTPGG